MKYNDPIIDPTLPNRPGMFLMRVRRRDGAEQLLWVPNEHHDRLCESAAGEFGDKSIIAIGRYKQ